MNNRQPMSMLSAAAQRIVESFLDETAATPFRRSDLAERLYPVTRPRSRDAANTLADKAIRALQNAGGLVRHEHLHWVQPTRHRRLLGGREVPELEIPVALTLKTRVPEKWAAIDLETGEVYVAGSAQRWTRMSDKEVPDLLAAVRLHVPGI